MGKLYRRKGSEDKLIVVVATKEEYKLAKQRFKHKRIIQTGVGGINVIQKLKRIPKWVKIINFGYAGSNNIPIGTEVKVRWCKLYHPNVDYEERTFVLSVHEGVPCYTSNDFVLETNINQPSVFDMELAYILALGFKKVESIKIISDNLSLEQYEETSQ